VHLGRAENALFLAITMLTLELIKNMRELVCFQQYPQSKDAPSILTKFEQQGYKKILTKKSKKLKK
jgi:hypothetical protein